MSTEGERAAGFGRLEDGLRQAGAWYIWGPYVSERQWGTVGVGQLVTLFQSLFDESMILSPYGLRSLSAGHLDATTATIDYEPAESTTSLAGGNSNWRGPVWFPLNYLVISCLEKYYRFFGDDDLRDRLISIFTRSTPDGRRRCFGDNAAGLGASHQTGWTALIADVIRRRHGAVRETVDLVGDLIDPLGEQQR